MKDCLGIGFPIVDDSDCPITLTATYDLLCFPSPQGVNTLPSSEILYLVYLT